ncbi:MAG: glycosyltransferase family 2 protein [Oscillospiraceae bacterium]|nr:glycosyltransferase family 2 protein [Oscillospiraceae bacterium]
MEFIRYFNIAVSVIFALCYAYQVVYILVPFLIKEKIQKGEKLHRYAVLICARNEEAVIANLIDSIKKQTYPGSLVTTFVVADNCTDSTAAIARRAGALVYERHDRSHTGKGRAMDFLLRSIDGDYSAGSFDGYFVFDADNLLRENYIAEMNRVFSTGYDVVTSFRNSKNYGDNWLTAGCGLWFMRESFFLNQSRHLLGLSCHVSGTGYMFSDKIYRELGGWPFHLLTEDIEFSAWNITAGRKIGYCATAQFFDEQPLALSQSVKQRVRWAKGNYQVFDKYGSLLIKKAVKEGSLSCADMVMNLAPVVLLTLASVMVNVSACVWAILAGRDTLPVALGIISTFRSVYWMFFAMGGLTTFTLWEHIHTTAIRKLAYIFTFPLFMMTYIPISVAALFMEVTWQPIIHSDSRNLTAVRNGR